MAKLAWHWPSFTPRLAMRCWSASARPSKLIGDMRRALISLDSDKPVSPQVLQDLKRRAREMDFKDLEAKVNVLYWLSKCSQGDSGDSEEFENLLLQFMLDVRKEAMYGNETQLVRILRILILSMNPQKNLRALDTDAQIQLERLVRELLTASMPRLKLRHQHLSLMQISMFLSSYAAMWLPEYRQIFEVLASDLVARINRMRRRQNIEIETEMADNLPYILASYGNASCMHPALFDTSISWCEENIGVITYDGIAVVSYAIASAGLHRPSFWQAVDHQIRLSADKWSLKSISKVCSSFRRLLLQDTFLPPEDNSLQELFKLASEEMLKRSEELTFQDAAEILLGLATFAEEDLPCWKELQRVCSQMTATLQEAPPMYLCSMFYAITAIDLHKSGESDLHEVHQVVAKALLPVLNVCLAPELEVMAQSLLALSQRATAEHLSSVGFRILLLVSQREAVRKAYDLGPKRAARLSCFLAAAAWPWQSALLQPWFLTEMSSFASSFETGFEGTYGSWLQKSPESVEPWPDSVAWYLTRHPKTSPAIVDVYGGPERLMGWEYQDDPSDPRTSNLDV